MEETTRCFFDIEINNRSAGRITFRLFPNSASRACQNFLALCNGSPSGFSNHREVGYRGSLFHRVVRGFMVQGGDFAHGDGGGNQPSISSGNDRISGSFQVAFTLAVAEEGTGASGSQFFITCAPCPFLDGKHVVFGVVEKGMKVVDAIENVACDSTGRPLVDVRIVDCGELDWAGGRVMPAVSRVVSGSHSPAGVTQSSPLFSNVDMDQSQAVKTLDKFHSDSRAALNNRGVSSSDKSHRGRGGFQRRGASSTNYQRPQNRYSPISQKDHNNARHESRQSFPPSNNRHPNGYRRGNHQRGNYRGGGGYNRGGGYMNNYNGKSRSTPT